MAITCLLAMAVSSLSTHVLQKLVTAAGLLVNLYSTKCKKYNIIHTKT